MQTEIRNRPSFANVLVQLDVGDRIVAEAGAMAMMSGSVAMTTRWSGGPLRAVLKRIFGSESLFVNEFTANGPGELVLTQAVPGDIECLALAGTTLYLQPGAYLASDPDVKLELGWAGWRSFIVGEGLFRLKVSGQGRVWFGAYGGIFSREVDEEYIVDSGHLVAYEPTIQIRVGMAGGLLTSFFSGEGIVTRVRGPGRIYMQSRNFSALAAWTNSHLW
ncbi:MAG: TIGR00266 family protein [Pirellulales bacterium]|nr:TIGR00266 family protein [Pirellulales bacterium]MBX3432194.1 TIGR00266 family protein [Pirellulales bacterium]